MEHKLKKVLNHATKQETQSAKSSQTEASSSSTGYVYKPAPPSFLLELGSFALDYSFPEIASSCVSAVNTESIRSNSSLLLHQEILKSQLAIEDAKKNFGGTYTKSSMEIRVKNLLRLEEILTTSARLEDHDITEVVIVTVR